ncbi:MAG: class I SAM-dependent methyltransferase [Sulfuricaulis sp.]
MHEILDAQQEHWQKTFFQRPEMFGAEPSEPARIMLEWLKREGKTRLLELGSGQGRDTLFLARNGLRVQALDYTATAVEAINDKARQFSLSESVTALQHDIRQPLPLADESFDACYSHMLYCMALTTSELEFLSREVWRVLRPGGLHIYTVRHTQDPDYGKGIPRGEDLYESGGFVVHYFSREKVARLAGGYEQLAIDEFEEGKLPRKLFRVTLRKPEAPK